MTNIPRLFVDAPLQLGESVLLDEGQGKYLTRVMRLADGATVRAFNGRDGEYACLLQVSGKQVAIVPAALRRQQYNGCDLTLLFAPLKKTRTDFVVEKASELGVVSVQPVITEFTQTTRVRVDRLRATAIEAAEQTERLDVPEISEAIPLGKALSAWNPAKPLYFCNEAATAKPMWECLTADAPTAAGILIGPEGGFSSREREILLALDFVIPITLGPRILRAETAVVSALTLWQSKLGDWHQRPYVPET